MPGPIVGYIILDREAGSPQEWSATMYGCAGELPPHLAGALGGGGDAQLWTRRADARKAIRLSVERRNRWLQEVLGQAPDCSEYDYRIIRVRSTANAQKES